MDQKWIQILLILVFYQKVASGAGESKTVKEGAEVDIHCYPGPKGSLVVWFRILDKSGMEFIDSFSNTGLKRNRMDSPSSVFSDSKMKQDILTLKSFDKDKDSGLYSCASLKGVELKFGKVTRLIGEKTRSPQLTTVTPVPTTERDLCTTASPCVCNNYETAEETSPSLVCSLVILAPLVGGCGLLFLLLVVTILYCNKIRTRRCPHHYKRKLRPTAGGKQVANNRHI